MEKNAWKERVRGVPRQGGLLKAAAVLIMAGAVVDQLLAIVMEDYYARITLFLCLLTIVGSVLLLTAKGKKANWMIGGALALLGAAAGAGGIGFNLFMAGSFYFDLHEMGMLTYIVVIAVVLLEMLSTKIKAKVR